TKGSSGRPIGVPIGARVKVTPSGQRLLVDDEGKERRLSPEQEASLKIMHPTSVEGVDDMIKLGDMTEAGLLRNLLLRHRQDIIYVSNTLKGKRIFTYTGSVLVAVNPYKDFPIYTEEQVRICRKLGELPPHIFAIAEACYFNMTRHQRNQCCIISGESGAGKTESTKLILQYLAAVSGELSEQRIEKQILESNPILEAFGNAKTIRNDNSSRFGKYLEIFFNKDGVIEGARVEQYLLEKSRVCHQALEERNYHIFYCLLAGISAEEKKRLSLGNAKEYKFLTKGNCIACGGRDDAKDYSRINSALKTLNFSGKDCHEIFKLLAALLHLGNVCFEANTQNNMESSDVSKSEHFNVAASLLEVEKPTLATNLTHRSFKTNREMVTKPLSCEQAADCRDAFVKAIYNKLFIWIVKKINSVIYKKLTSNSKSAYLSVGLLDIFGFENFNTNSFEQLCINFANEKLQQFFVAHIFKLEQKEYLKQGVVWDNINFSDNQKILDLLAGIQCNVLALVDEESHFPKGTDATMLEKLNQHHKGNKNYIASRSERDTKFGICHFAGLVQYDSNGFLEKNRDAVSSDIMKMLDMSANKLLFSFCHVSSSQGLADTRKQVPTLSGQFRQSLDSLMKALSACQPFFIRCFKPNNDKQSEVFDRELCMRQLRYSGMIDTIRIRKLGFPIRHTFDDFLKRYRVLLKTNICDPNTSALTCCKAICEALIEREGEWKIGNTKVFLKVLKTCNCKPCCVVAFSRGTVCQDMCVRLTSGINSLFPPKTSHSSPEPVKKNSELLKTELIVTPPSNSISPTPSVDEHDEEEEENDDFEDDGDEYSFYRFSQRYFQGNASHTHLPYRLKKSLLHHDDEGDALACLTIWWIILRFMGDIPEPKASDAISVASSNTPQAPPSRQGRRLSNLVGLDQVNYCIYLIITLKKTQSNYLTSSNDGTTLQRPLSDLEKIHIIIGYALDEIYCQICKQLVKNSDRRSRMQGWILLSICLGIFPPTDLFRKYLENFLRRGPYDYRGYCTERLKRIVANGQRKELPCWIELQVKSRRKPIETTVAIQDGRNIEIQLDSSSTSEEVCQDVANDIGLKDTYGFSLYISLYDKMWSLGNSGAHVLDAISQCEEEMRRQGRLEKDAPWSLSLRKELFTPWHECRLDEVSTDLIYRQIIKGIKAAEYVADKDDDYIQLAIMHYYIKFGSEYSVENFTRVVDECITTQLIESKSKTRWTQFISSAHKEGPYVSGRQNSDEVKGELVDIARKKWAIHFSKFFEVTMMSGPPLPKSRFIVAVNWTGIFFMDERNRQLHEIPYIAVRKTISLITITGEYVLKSAEAEKMAALIENNVEGLRQRSVFATAQQDSSKSGKSLQLLIFLAKWHFSKMWHSCLTLHLANRTALVQPIFKLFVPRRSVGGGRQGYKGGNREKLWVISREPLKQPLLKVLVNNSELSNLACSPLPILKYMGDYPIKHVRSPVELTDQIFGPATKHEELRDEIYCQIMRQMTANSNSLSMERGWQLMWLCSGLFPPSYDLLKYTQRFLESRPRYPLAALCLERLQEICRSPRNLPPHFVEVDAIQQNSPKIFQKVHFPDDTTDVRTFEVTSTTTIADMCISIASQLILNSPEGYGLYLKTLTKVGSNQCKSRFFSVTQANLPSLVLFKRKLWFNVNPGKDVKADLTFHFPQERSRYLRGYHDCTKEDMITLGGLLFRVKVESDMSQFVMIPKMLKDLVPADQQKIMSPDEWKKAILYFIQQSGITVDEAKIDFLKIISIWPTFGCTFFEVKQTCESSYPAILLIGINKQGVRLIDPETKEILIMHEFSRITEYFSKGNSFQMTIGTLFRGVTFVCETPNAHTIEDLLRSYVSMYEKARQAPLNHRKSIFS
uniref:Myosin VIIBb n=1 Tax=Oreochromis niloticus TaxID=8128 RepID=I3KQX6_ORENI